jgi:predicted metal-dependent phosphoesterase TrpH
VIDLHTHTTASDGRCTPEELVVRAAAAGVSVLSVTDHDTVAGGEAADRAAVAAGIEFVFGIEITSILDGLDIHVLGYFIGSRSASLNAFLAEQRMRRVDRTREVIARLSALGMPLDAEAIVKPAIDDPEKSIGRPAVARALVAAGYVADVTQAFERWLSNGRPAFVPRLAAAPSEVFERIHEAGGIASLAHPGPIGRDEWIPSFAGAGLDAIEAYHTDHDAQTTARYVALAERLGLGVSGGSDYHADHEHGGGPGSVSLPREAFELLKRRVRRDKYEVR